VSGEHLPIREDDCSDRALPDLPDSCYPPVAVALDVDRAVVLEGVEPDALAWRLIAHLASNWGEHLDWEDVPHLAEVSWEQVAAELDEIATWVSNHADAFDQASNVDSRDLYSRVVEQ